MPILSAPSSITFEQNHDLNRQFVCITRYKLINIITNITSNMTMQIGIVSFWSKNLMMNSQNLSFLKKETILHPIVLYLLIFLILA